MASRDQYFSLVPR
ncbi:hypothetical protein LINPERPRIM_LOCUS39195 [Linum perenne]